MTFYQLLFLVFFVSTYNCQEGYYGVQFVNEFEPPGLEQSLWSNTPFKVVGCDSNDLSGSRVVPVDNNEVLSLEGAHEKFFKSREGDGCEPKKRSSPRQGNVKTRVITRKPIIKYKTVDLPPRVQYIRGVRPRQVPITHFITVYEPYSKPVYIPRKMVRKIITVPHEIIRERVVPERKQVVIDQPKLVRERKTITRTKTQYQYVESKNEKCAPLATISPYPEEVQSQGRSNVCAY